MSHKSVDSPYVCMTNRMRTTIPLASPSHFGDNRQLSIPPRRVRRLLWVILGTSQRNSAIHLSSLLYPVRKNDRLARFYENCFAVSQGWLMFSPSLKHSSRITPLDGIHSTNHRASRLYSTVYFNSFHFEQQWYFYIYISLSLLAAPPTPIIRLCNLTSLFLEKWRVPSR